MDTLCSSACYRLWLDLVLSLRGDKARLWWLHFLQRSPAPGRTLCVHLPDLMRVWKLSAPFPASRAVYAVGLEVFSRPLKPGPEGVTGRQAVLPGGP